MCSSPDSRFIIVPYIESPVCGVEGTTGRVSLRGTILAVVVDGSAAVRGEEDALGEETGVVEAEVAIVVGELAGDSCAEMDDVMTESDSAALDAVPFDDSSDLTDCVTSTCDAVVVEVTAGLDDIADSTTGAVDDVARGVVFWEGIDAEFSTGRESRAGIRTGTIVEVVQMASAVVGDAEDRGMTELDVADRV